MSFLTRFRRQSTQGRATAEDDLTPAGRPRDRARRVAAQVVTVLALLLVLVALLVPNKLTRVTPGSFVRLPMEALLGLALVLVVPRWARRLTAVLLGLGLGLVTIVKVIDMGFYAILARPFHAVFDWALFGPLVEFAGQSMGRPGAIGVVVLAVLLALAVLGLMTLSTLRLSRLVVRHRTTATSAFAVLAVVSIAFAMVGVKVVPDVPVSSLAYSRLLQVRTDLRDQEAFAAEAAADAFRNTRGEEMLTALRGKDVVLAFVESYGRDALENPEYAPQVRAVLDAGDRRLRAAGFGSRSAFLTSPSRGGSSWLAHATLLSGLWINHQGRYNALVNSDRLTLNGAFRRAGWRTVGVMPGVGRAWPEGAFFGYDRIYTRQDMGYRGPEFPLKGMPDQYTLSVFERFERARPGHGPVMAEIPLTSSHMWWTPVPRLVGWDEVGDGSIFETAKDGPPARSSWRDPSRINADYLRCIEYSLNTLLSYVETYGDDDLVVVFLGDHQASSLITAKGANRDVPITVVARDPAVLKQISGWQWQDGLAPGPQAPAWRMDTFRDRFLATYGPPARHVRSPALAGY